MHIRADKPTGQAASRRRSDLSRTLPKPLRGHFLHFHGKQFPFGQQRARSSVLPLEELSVKGGTYEMLGLGYLPGGHLPPPKFGHLPLPNSDIYHPQKPYICQEDNCHPQFFFFFFWCTFLGFFDLQLMEDIKDGKEEVLDEVVMEHIK